MARRPHDFLDGTMADVIAIEAEDAANHAVDLARWSAEEYEASLRGPTEAYRRLAAWRRNAWNAFASEAWDAALIFDFERGALP